MQKGLLGVKPVLRLIPDGRAGAVEDIGGDLLARVGGQAVQDGRAWLCHAEQVGIDPEGREVGATALGLGLVAHAHPDVGVDRIDTGGGEARVLG